MSLKLYLSVEPYNGEPHLPDLNPAPQPPLKVHNITAIRITSTSVRITWNKQQRKQKAKKFCKIWQKGRITESYRWILQVLVWDNWTDFSKNNKTIKEINKMEFNDSNSANGHIDNKILTKDACQNQNYLLTNISPSAYYKFQIKVEKYDDGKYANITASNGSYIHYFTKQS